MQEVKYFKTQDLVLKISKNYDLTRLNLDEWERFLDVLCTDRDYQKQAIRLAIVYLFSGKYQNIEDLVSENWRKNAELQNRYKDVQDYHKKIQLPHRLSATLDLATGTGKSFVMYGIAQIALGLGLVDRVLVLCPSLTIEKGLKQKFTELASDGRLKNALPENSRYKNPRIVDASVTIMAGDICVENIHAVYNKNSSSITDSLGYGKGATCLVLNDEVHHAYNKTSGNDTVAKDIKKWKEFLLDNAYQFRYMLGFTGTAYIESEYFNDVIFRYSLRQAIEDRIVKTVFYVAKDEETKEHDEKYQKIYQNHKSNKERYHQVKPLTLLVTQEIKQAEQLKEELCEFLAKKENLPIEEIRQNKVLIVTSKHKENVDLYLPTVDSAENSFEWIVSVSMLTEGWDVKNVFQIIPTEERAFNSKLLIAQVLGRGLRLPKDYPQAQVTVFNHDKWTGKIKKLVDEVLEYEMKLEAWPLLSPSPRSQYHFKLYNFNYEKTPDETTARETKVFDYTKDYIELTAQVDKYDVSTHYTNTKAEDRQIVYGIEKEMFSVDSIVTKIMEEFRVREWEGVTLKLKEGEYTKNDLPARKTIERIIRNSMDRRQISGDVLDRRNQQAVYSAFNTLLRKKSKSVIHRREATEPYVLETTKREKESLSVGSLRKDCAVFYTPDFETEITNEDVKLVFREVIETLPRNVAKDINTSLFKTPVDLVFTTAKPERDFVDNLCKPVNASKIKAWFKSKSQSFYSIEYSITSEAGKHTKHGKFNPDFFICIERNNIEYIIIIEIKADGDDTAENKAKFKYADQHFRDLNVELSNMEVNQKYYFHFLTPMNYPEFFKYLQDDRLIFDNDTFRSELETQLIG